MPRDDGGLAAQVVELVEQVKQLAAMVDHLENWIADVAAGRYA